MKSIIKKFWDLIKNYKHLYLLAGFALITATMFQLLFPWLLRKAIDALTDVNLSNEVLYFCVLLLITASGEALFTFLKGRLAAKASESTIRDLRNRIFSHIMAMPIALHSRMQTGDMIQRATSDIQTLGRFLGNQIPEVARTLCLLTGVSALMFALNVELAIWALLVLPFIFLFSMLFFSKIRNRFEQYDECEAMLSSMIQEYLTGVRVVKAFARESYEQETFNRTNQRMVKEDIELTNLHAIFWPTSDFLCMIQVVLVLLVGGIKTITGEISLGTFVAFNSYVMLLIWPVRQIGRLLGEMGRASVSLHRIKEILDFPVELPEIRKKTRRLRFRKQLAFENVQFGFDDAPLLKNINFAVRAGQTVAILGSTGSGKTTLMQLLARFRDDYKGQITLDGRDIRKSPRELVRSGIGFVMQEPFLFSRSLMANIAFGVDGATMEEIRDAARAADVESFVNQFPEGYETIIGERGVTLSGGQRQRVALARILLKKPSIIILDDTTSALDTKTEAFICNALKKRLSGSTTIIITHRLSTAAGADTIVVLENGEIVQQGSHHQLIQVQGYYRHLHESQWKKQSKLNEEVRHGINKTNRKRVPKTVRFRSLAKNTPVA